MIFVDTGAWIALTDRSDQYHDDAKSIYLRLRSERERFVTTDYIIDETITRLRYDANHQHAVRFLDLIALAEKTGVLNRITITAEIFDEALRLFRQYDTVKLSFTDCTSFVVCRRHHITEAFAFDQHFFMQGIVLCRV